MTFAKIAYPRPDIHCDRFDHAPLHIMHASTTSVGNVGKLPKRSMKERCNAGSREWRSLRSIAERIRRRTRTA
jgi:hypothetical protein